MLGHVYEIFIDRKKFFGLIYMPRLVSENNIKVRVYKNKIMIKDFQYARGGYEFREYKKGK